MKKKITISDVAKYAGVSRTTVSYAINNVNKISEETRQRVLQAIKELDYQPDFTAISLSKRKSNIIGIIIPTLKSSHSTLLKEDHSYTEFLGGMEFVSKKQDYDLLISWTSNSDDWNNWVKKRNLDGLIIIGYFPKSSYLKMKKLDIPIVLIDNYDKEGSSYHNIRIDDELGGYLATKHLIEMGHTRISFVGHDLHNFSIDLNRINGFKRALTETGISIDENLIFDGKGNFFEVGYQKGVKLLEYGDKITAIFASSDILAIGIIKALQENGKQIPIDYSIVGFDDLAVSRYSSPSLTTIRQDLFNKGITAGELIINLIKEKTPVPKNVTLPIKLIVRESTQSL